jgi:hypothetical protein
VVRFMLDISVREGDKHLCAKALREFPRILRARNASQRKYSLRKASRWFKMGLDDLKAHGRELYHPSDAMDALGLRRRWERQVGEEKRLLGL